MKEEMVYKEFRVVIEDENNLRIIKPSGMSRRANMQMDPLKKRTIKPTKLSLAEKVKQLQPHVLHFIGHGQYRRGEGYLALVKDDLKTARWVNEMDLADCFLDYQPRLIFLHACQGAHAESYKAFMVIALKLAHQKVSAVMAMQYEVTNEVANIFANRFYKSLGEGKPIDVAVQDGRLELSMYLEEENFSSRAFGSPVVYLQSAENIIIPSHRCPSCEAEAHENDRFCGECGKSLRS